MSFQAAAGPAAELGHIAFASLLHIGFQLGHVFLDMEMKHTNFFSHILQRLLLVILLYTLFAKQSLCCPTFQYSREFSG